MDEDDYLVVEEMERYGGSFVKALAKLARHADPINLFLIKTTWPDYWEEYSNFKRNRKNKK